MAVAAAQVSKQDPMNTVVLATGVSPVNATGPPPQVSRKAAQRARATLSNAGMKERSTGYGKGTT